MALKDLVADASKIDEEAIEAIIANFVRYDPTEAKIVFTSGGTALKNEQRLLVYLVAVLGWKYVVDEPPNPKTKPSDIEIATGISGGTLRPLLKKLKDSHLVSVVNGHYFIQSANFETVRRTVAEGGTSRHATRKRKPRPKSDSTRVDKHLHESNGKPRKGAAGELQTKLEEWLSDGYFSQDRTIKDLQNKYHEHAIIVKQTSLSGLLLRAVRSGLLTRAKVERNGKQVWSYRVSSNDQAA